MAKYKKLLWHRGFFTFPGCGTCAPEAHPQTIATPRFKARYGTGATFPAVIRKPANAGRTCPPEKDQTENNLPWSDIGSATERLFSVKVYDPGTSYTHPHFVRFFVRLFATAWRLVSFVRLTDTLCLSVYVS
jgi:hypothetical protein